MHSRHLALLSTLYLFFFSGLQAQVQDDYIYLSVDRIFSQSDDFQKVNLWADGLLKFSTKDTGHLIGRWTKENPDQNQLLGKVVITDLKDDGIKANIYPPIATRYDLAGVKLSKKMKAERSIFYELARLNIFFTDIYEENSYTFHEFFKKDSPERTEELIDLYIEDIKFVAKEMANQGMENQMIEGGRFDGMKIFDAMQKTTDKDLKDFLGYVIARPQKYMGHSWKISETYATWVVSKTPTTTETLVSQLIASVNQQQSRSGKEDCNGDVLFLDLAQGTLNGIAATASMDEVKENLPCFTGESEEGKIMNCNGGVFFNNHLLYFYTGNDYIQVRGGFKGKMSQDLLGKSIEEIEAMFGKPDRIPVDEGENDWGFEEDIQYLYQRDYGTLGLAFYPETKKVRTVSVHARKVKDVEICW